MLSLFGPSRRAFGSLDEQEILALAIASEEEDGRIYMAYAQRLEQDYPATAAIFRDMAEVEDAHRRNLITLYRQRFGEVIPPIRREHVRGFYDRRPDWLQKNLPFRTIREETERMERQAARFYREAAGQVTDAATRALLGELAMAEESHGSIAHALSERRRPDDVAAGETRTARRQLVLTWIQPGLAGLMDGSVSTLAPIFAAAFATGNTWQTFLVGLSASVGAGISMGFTEAAHDDGKLSGRGAPWKRGLASGVMTALGGLGHALPYLIPDFTVATTIAVIVVFIELWAIAFIQNRFMDTPFFRAVMQVVLGGSLVLAAGILIGQG